MADENLGGAVTELNSIAQTLKDLVAKMPDSSGGGKAGGKTANEKKKEKADKDRIEAEGLVVNAVKQAGQSLIGFGKSINDIAAAGARLANSLGQTVTGGIDQEFRNRNTILKQIFVKNKDSIVAMDQIISAQQSFASTFMGAAEGMQIGDEGVKKFAATLKTGFKSDFKLTGDSMRALVTAGVATEQGFESLRKASGRASLSNAQLATLVNKNSLSFMLYGPKFAKAAQEAERLGINLAATQAAQESMVSNLDNTLDTLNQVNQLGANIDFGTLTRLNETQGPEATLKYLQSTIPPSLFQSASVRAMLRNFGIPLEDLMKKQGSAQDNAAKTIEASLSELKEPIGTIANILSEVTQRFNSLKESFGPQIVAFGKLVLSVIVATRVISAFGGLAATISTVWKSLDLFGGGVAAKIKSKMVGGGVTNAGESIVKGTSAGGGGLGGGAAGGGIGAFLKGLAGGLKAIANPQALLGLAAVTLAIIGIGYALKLAAPGIQAFGLAIKSAFEGIGTIIKSIGTAIATVITAIGTQFVAMFKALQTANPAQIAALAVSLGLLGPALILFAGGLVAASAASLLGGGIINKITALGAAGAGVVALAGAMKTLKTSLDELNSVDTSKLNDIKSFTNAATVNTAVGNVTAPFAAIAGTIRSATAKVIGGGEEQGTSKLVKKVDELIVLLRDTKTVINIDNKVQQLPRTALAGVTVRNDRI